MTSSIADSSPRKMSNQETVKLLQVCHVLTSNNFHHLLVIAVETYSGVVVFQADEVEIAGILTGSRLRESLRA